MRMNFMLVIVIKNACMNSRRNITSASSIRFGTPRSSLFQLCNHMSGFSCSFPVCNRSRRVSLSKSRIFGNFTKLQTISEIFSCWIFSTNFWLVNSMLDMIFLENVSYIRPIWKRQLFRLQYWTKWSPYLLLLAGTFFIFK